MVNLNILKTIAMIAGGVAIGYVFKDKLSLLINKPTPTAAASAAEQFYDSYYAVPGDKRMYDNSNYASYPAFVYPSRRFDKYYQSFEEGQNNSLPAMW